MKRLTRRRAFHLMGAAAAGTMAAPLALFHARATVGASHGGTGYGALKPVVPLNSADLGNTVIGDLRGMPLLDLPAGFRYSAVSITGQRLGDGMLVPGNHDGMACFAGPDGAMILVRNHELNPGEVRFGSAAGVAAPREKHWDAAATGGTTTLHLDSDGRLLRHFGSLGGTIRNCAGGPTPWGSWISCEETVDVPVAGNGLQRKHGYNFEVPAAATGFVEPVPLTDMGRFRHEAVAVDPVTGFLYQTEDRKKSAFYRFRPRKKGVLRAGGILEAMAVDDVRLDRKRSGSGDMRRGIKNLVGVPMRVRWVRIEEPDPAGDTVRREARSKGAAWFARGEGAWYGAGRIYFVSTSGGDAGLGQVWAYDARRETLSLIVESSGTTELDRPDNVTVAPDGCLYLCEDGPGEQFVVGVSREGRLFRFARNAVVWPSRGSAPDNSEFAGACFSPDGRWMFVNNYGVGITFCIQGPWSRLRH